MFRMREINDNNDTRQEGGSKNISLLQGTCTTYGIAQCYSDWTCISVNVQGTTKKVKIEAELIY